MGKEYSMHKRRNVYRDFVGNPEGERPLGRPRHRWENNIEMDFRDTGWVDLD
jgi:hypothetical protein